MCESIRFRGISSVIIHVDEPLVVGFMGDG